MPNNKDDNQANIDREQSVFEVQKADVERLLGEALSKYKEITEGWHIHDAILEELEKLRINITDALSVLENMEEGEWIFHCVSCNAKIARPVGVGPPSTCPECGQSDGKPKGGYHLICPSCEWKSPTDHGGVLKNCPSCGASMEGE